MFSYLKQGPSQTSVDFKTIQKQNTNQFNIILRKLEKTWKNCLITSRKLK